MDGRKRRAAPDRSSRPGDENSVRQIRCATGSPEENGLSAPSSAPRLDVANRSEIVHSLTLHRH
jgi:hypothetical protein